MRTHLMTIFAILTIFDICLPFVVAIFDHFFFTVFDHFGQFLTNYDHFDHFCQILPRPKKKIFGSAFFNFSCSATRDADRMQIQKLHQRTDGRSRVCARDACASKKLQVFLKKYPCSFVHFNGVHKNSLLTSNPKLVVIWRGIFWANQIASSWLDWRL